MQPIKLLPENTLKENFWIYGNMCLEGGLQYSDQDKAEIDLLLEAFEKKQSIWVWGSNGTGKTFVFEILKRILNPQSELRFRGRNVLDTVLDFNTRGHECFRDDQDNSVLYDDLGTEDKGYWYGDKVEVFEKLIQFRYDKWRSTGLRTFITTNLTKEEIAPRYGSRFRDRMKEQFVQIILSGESKRNLRNFKGFIPIIHERILTQEQIEWNKYYNERREAIKKANEENPQPTQRKGIGTLLKERWEQMGGGI